MSEFVYYVKVWTICSSCTLLLLVKDVISHYINPGGFNLYSYVVNKKKPLLRRIGLPVLVTAILFLAALLWSGYTGKPISVNNLF